ncbi:MAG: SUMF1/EgtB/PvdO family nonheme iron enzyme [Polyangiaceae bacterium]
MRALQFTASVAIVVAVFGPQQGGASPAKASTGKEAQGPGSGATQPQDRMAQAALGGAATEATPTRKWQLVSGRSWQLLSDKSEPTSVTDAREGNRGSCPAGMVSVRGRMVDEPNLDALQLRACTKWISREFPERCAEYDRDKWLAIVKDLPTKPMDFCIDRFEYPNVKGQNPIVMVTWYEARDSCKAQGKRLCTETEWTFACEGEEATPYPTGYSRDPKHCVIDEPWGMPKEGSLLPRDSEHAMLEVDRLWHGEPSGGERSCASPFGVYDMTGNVDEWTRSAIPGERPSVLKGGYFGPVRTRCRPATKAHGEGHVYYQQGFRCCANDAPAQAQAQATR